ncbi:MAG: hypothetical protein FOGNACKC_02779 [Anaerolineae bacterium]|nr:hypothetical protein [Anaerolineae bacterium]
MNNSARNWVLFQRSNKETERAWTDTCDVARVVNI